MLNVKENVRETLKKDGKPDRFVNQFEYLATVITPQQMVNPRPEYGGPEVVNAWGVTNAWPEGTPGAFPVHTPDKILIKDIEHWQDYVKRAPASGFPDEMWGATMGMASMADRENQFIAPFIAPGIFEQCHHFCEIQNAMIYLYEYPDEMHDLIKFLTEWELEVAEDICAHLHPDAIFHHDDWGSQQSTFMSPAMFEDFYMDSYKQIYGYYHEHGVELIVHHSDSYAATLVPDMIEMGIDIWQGAMSTNNIPELIEKYKGQIGIMSGIDSAWVDNPEWSRERCAIEVKKLCDQYAEPNGLIPCISQGGPMSTYPEVYMITCDELAKYNQERFGVSSNFNGRDVMSKRYGAEES